MPLPLALAHGVRGQPVLAASCCDHGTDSMTRKLIYSGLVAGLMCGCQSTRNEACCDRCVPPKTYCCSGYGKWHDKFVSQATSAKCAYDDLKDLQKTCGKRSKHFEQGFYDAYGDLAQGRISQVPPVPPRQYWSAYYRSCAGAADVADWFEGYRTGLDYGTRGGVSRFNRVATSWDGSSACLYSGATDNPDVIPSSDNWMSQTQTPPAAATEARPSPSQAAPPEAPNIVERPAVPPVRDRYQTQPTTYRPH